MNWKEIFIDALMDTLRTVPFLFAAYLLIETIERRHSERIEHILAGGGRFGFVPGALLGLIPQCGFSAMAANLYASRVISPGTLLAVFLSTSDEAVPLLIASPGHWRSLGALLAAKLGVALAAGAAVDLLLARFLPADMRGGYAGSANAVDCHEHEERDGIWKAAAKHTLRILIYIAAFNLVLGLLTAAVGEDAIAAFLTTAGPWQPFAAAAIGLVPGCASSILITRLYMSGALSFAAAVAGLSTGAGVGLAVLLRANKSRKQNLFIVALLYAVGVLSYYILICLP